MRTRKVHIVIAIILSLLLLSNVLAEGKILRFTYISAVSAKLSISGSTATVSGMIIPDSNYATDVTVRLQKLESNGTWSTVASWSDSNSAGYSSAGGSATITAGETYRTYTIGHVYDGDGNVIDTGTAYKY